MISDNIDADFIRQTIPNVMLDVEGEQPFAEKLQPFILQAESRLMAEYLPSSDFLRADDVYVASTYILLTAFADAVPFLDLVVTPTGFGVVSTDAIAPASKERVERLIATTRQSAEDTLDLLLEHLRRYEQWRSSERGAYFGATFLSSPKDAKAAGAESYDTLRTTAMQAESFIARHFLGSALMSRLRSEFNARDPFTYLPLHDTVRTAVLQCVRLVLHKDFLTPEAVWHFCQPAFPILESMPEYHDMWQKEMGPLFSFPRFQNNTKGAYFF